MERLSSRIADKIAVNTNADHDGREVIQYGVTAILHISLFLALIAVLGVVFDVLMPILTICLAAAFFRQNSGGAHAVNSLLCTSIGCLACLLLSLFAKYFVTLQVPFQFYTVLAAVTVFLAVLATIVLVPVDTPNKPIKTIEKKKRMKRNSGIILAIYTILMVISLILGRSRPQWSLFLVCMCLGVLWQTLLLTKFGRRFFTLIQSPFVRASLRSEHK